VRGRPAMPFSGVAEVAEGGVAASSAVEPAASASRQTPRNRPVDTKSANNRDRVAAPRAEPAGLPWNCIAFVIGCSRWIEGCDARASSLTAGRRLWWFKSYAH
jgi:hypothetical protein